MSDVLTDEQLQEAFGFTPVGGAASYQIPALRNVESAVVAALAARGDVNVDRIATAAAIDCEYANRTTPTPKIIADAIRLAIASTAAKYEAEIASLDESRVALVAEHEVREKLWRELWQLDGGNAWLTQGKRARSLRAELGLENVK